MKSEHNIGGNNKIKHDATATLEVSQLSDKFRHLFVSVQCILPIKFQVLSIVPPTFSDINFYQNHVIRVISFSKTKILILNK